MATRSVIDNVGSGSAFEQIARVRPLVLPIVVFVIGSGGSTPKEAVENVEKVRKETIELLQSFFEGIHWVVDIK